ncbi:MAG: hypothetical protein ACOCY9_03160 [Desulfohalobiaceae bacterium]
MFSRKYMRIFWNKQFRAWVRCLRLLCAGLIFAGLGLCVACPWAFAKSSSVVVNGRAPVIAEDTVQARDEAIADARIRAVEEVVGVEIEASSVLSHELMLESTTSTHSRGIIHNEEVLSEHEDEQGQYHVRLKAEVSPAEAEERLTRLLREDRILILFEESNLGQDDAGNVLQNKFTDELNKMGYQNLVSWEPAAKGKKLKKDVELNAVKDMALQHMADIVIIGELSSEFSSQLGDNFYSAHARGWVRAYLVSQKKVLASSQIQAERGFGPDKEKAGKNSLANAAEKLSSDILQEIVPRSVRSLDVVYYGLEDFSAYKKHKRQLALMRWVQNVDSERFHPEKTVFQVDFSENPEILASRLDNLPGLAVEEFGSKKIEVRINQP